MPTWAKVVLGVLAALVLTCGLAIGAGAWWFDRNKDRLKETGQRVMQDGKDFGAHADSEACVVEALRRLDAKGGFMEQVEHKIFLEACLEAATRTPDFCVGVPPKEEIMKAAQWAVGECARRGHPTQECGRLVQAVQEACFGRK